MNEMEGNWIGVVAIAGDGGGIVGEVVIDLVLNFEPVIMFGPVGSQVCHASCRWSFIGPISRETPRWSKMLYFGPRPIDKFLVDGDVVRCR